MKIPISLEKQVKLIAKIKRELSDKYCSQLLSLCISGSHLYGFPSKDSDLDVRGIFILNSNKMLGLSKPKRIIDIASKEKPIEIDDNKYSDIRLHELGKETSLLLKSNCNAFERLVAYKIYTNPSYLDWKKHMLNLLCKFGIYKSYRGMATHNYKKFIKSGRKNTLKKYLYVFRSLMAGIRALEDRRITPDINELNKSFNLKSVMKLVKFKMEGKEEDDLPDSISPTILDSLILFLLDRIDSVYMKSKLPESVTQDEFKEVNELIIQIRKKYF